MVITSRFNIDVPDCSIQKWMFGSSCGPISERRVWIDADNPHTRYLTLSSARLLAKRLAVGLLDHGLQPGDRVMVFSGNSIIFPAAMLGIWMAGGIFTGAHPGYVARELAFQLNDSGARIMLATSDNLDVALEAAEMAGMDIDNVFAFDDKIPDVETERTLSLLKPDHWTRLVASKERGEAFEWMEPEDPRTTTCTLNYSSGTTGLPKGVEITHYNLVANCHGIITTHKLHPEYEQRIERDSTLCFLPMFHSFCQGYFLTTFPCEGIPVYVMPHFDTAKMLQHIAEFRITKLFAVPPILMILSKHPLAKKADLSSLEMIASGAAPLAAETQRKVTRLLSPNSDGGPKQGYGMTELTCTAMAWDPTHLSKDGVGELMPDCQAKIIHVDTGEEILEADVPGELYVSAPTLMLGYWNNPEATSKSISMDAIGRRWLRTGDIAYVSSAYQPGAIFHLVDRVKELIKVRGYQVSPTELDAVLLERHDIIDAAVVGVTMNGDEVPRAYVVCKPGVVATSEKEIEEWVSARVAPYKRLRGGIVFVDAIPKNPSGKILRKVLKERARREIEAERPRL